MAIPNTPVPAPGQLIATPPDFPVVWTDPRDAGQSWSFDPIHFPRPLAPLTHAVAAAFMGGGNAGFAQVGLPMSRFERFNTYAYACIMPTAAPPEAVPGQQPVAAVNLIIERFEANWNDELLPEIKQHIAHFESSDLRGMSLDQLRAHLAETVKRVARMGSLHFLAMLPGWYALSQFEELYCELFEGATTLEALRLLQGLDNKTMQGDRALWRLSRAALANPEVAAILSGYAAGAVVHALEQSAASQRFLADLRAWLAQYGQRLNSALALSEPSWIEDPTHAIEYLQGYVRQSEVRPDMDPAAMAAERQQAVAEARAKLAGYPQPVSARFEMLLKAAQVAAVINEDHNHWIDQRLFYHVRRVILEFGQRLAQAGALARADDVFYLTPEELQTWREGALKGRVQARQAEMEHFSRVSPPPMLGTMPALAMTDGNPMLRALLKAEMGPPNQNKPEAHRVTGLAGSAGVARGTARVIHSLAEASKLQPGDVLVAVSTVPPWTPLFATAAAVVTDTGGVLCHSAVVAREYHIPAVVGTDRATTTFQDGDWLEVDGNAGTVRVVVETVADELALVGRPQIL